MNDLKTLDGRIGEFKILKRSHFIHLTILECINKRILRMKNFIIHFVRLSDHFKVFVNAQ